MATIADLDPQLATIFEQLNSEMKLSESNDLLPSQEDDSSSDKASETELCLVSCVHDRKQGPSAMIKCCSCMYSSGPSCMLWRRQEALQGGLELFRL